MTVRSDKMPRMGLLERFRNWLSGGADREEMSEAAFGGAPAGAGMGHHHPAAETLPDDDRGVEGGPPSHDDPFAPRVP